MNPDLRIVQGVAWAACRGLMAPDERPRRRHEPREDRLGPMLNHAFVAPTSPVAQRTVFETVVTHGQRVEVYHNFGVAESVLKSTSHSLGPASCFETMAAAGSASCPASRRGLFATIETYLKQDVMRWRQMTHAVRDLWRGC
jgi:hypothetical protein